VTDELSSPRRLIPLGVMGALLMSTYGVARPAAESLFIGQYGSGALPQVWLAVAAVSLVVVSLYNRVAASGSLMRIYAWVAGGSGALLGGLLLLRDVAPGPATWALYVWKDVYIIVLIEIFWTYANSVFDMKRARTTYGLFLAAGELGSIAGNRGVGWLATNTSLGTVGGLWLVVPALAAVAVFAVLLAPRLPVPARAAKTSDWLEGFRVLASSRFVLLMLLLIGTTQMVITLVDFEFNAVVEQAVPGTDARTDFIGKVYIAVNILSFAMMLASPWILRFAGVGGVLLAVPVILAGAVTGFAVAPVLLMMAAAKVASKAFDYSIFRTAKEMLYIPLGVREKTQGKALVDMLTYRFAKAGASLLLMGVAAAGMAGARLPMTLALLAVWIGLTVVIVRKHRAAVAAGTAPNDTARAVG
jgi:ATP:ADP antiporter, AAA family